MDPPMLFPQSPGLPLFSLSPERVNGTRAQYGEDTKPSLTMDLRMPQSPSLPSLPSWSPTKTSHGRTSSDVQGMVARFNGLEINDHVEMRRRDELALKKAEMGREQAELRVEKLREELRRMQKEGAEGRDRERRMAKRIEALTEEKVRREETHAHAQNIYEKEIRKARKDQYKSESFLVKAQEELKMSRKQLNAAHVTIDIEKAKATQREQDAFQAEYKFVGLQEELAKMQERIKIIEEERDALKTSLKEEEVARVAAEGRIALPTSKDNEDDEFASPKKSPAKRRLIDFNEDKENVSPQRALETKNFREDLAKERSRRMKAEEIIEFMKMECQFERCSCRLAERNGSKYVHDTKFTARIRKLRPKLEEIPEPEAVGIYEDVIMGDEQTTESTNKPSVSPAPSPKEEQLETTMDVETADQEPENTIRFSPNSGTFRKSSVKVEEDITSTEESASEDIPNDEEGEESRLARSTTPAYPPPSQMHDDTTIIPDEPTLTPQEPQLEEPFPENDVKLEDDSSENVATVLATILSAEPIWPERRASSSPPSPPSVSTPFTPKLQEIHTTTTIPVHFTPQPSANPPFSPTDVSFTPSSSTIALPALPRQPFTPNPRDPSPNTVDENGNPIAPATIDREAALEAIRQRRGRARSFAEGKLTPRTQMLEVGTHALERRDISAPVLGTASVGKVNLQRLTRSASRGKK